MEASQKLVARQRDRVIATILDYKERECDQYLPVDVAKGLRKIVLDQLNDYTNFVGDFCDSTIYVNELWVAQIRELVDGSDG